jgi:hypothetical protein
VNRSKHEVRLWSEIQGYFFSSFLSKKDTDLTRKIEFFTRKSLFCVFLKISKTGDPKNDQKWQFLADFGRF